MILKKGRDGTGFFYSDESIAKSGLTYEGVGTPEPGDFIYKDLNGDGVINDRDKAPIGYSSYCLASTTVSLYLPTGKDSMFLSCCRE